MDQNNNINPTKSSPFTDGYMKNVINSEHNIHKYQQTKELEQNSDYCDDTPYPSSSIANNAQLQKKRVSFSAALHDVVPSPESVNNQHNSYDMYDDDDDNDDYGEEYDDDDDDDEEDETKRKHIPTFRLPITKRTSQTPGEGRHPGSNELYGTRHSPPPKASSNVVSLLTFLETRRRSHAFSISAIDETLPMDMGYDDEEHHGDSYEENNHTARFLRDFNTFQNSKKPKVFRHAEIPTSDYNRILLSKQSNDVLELKRFRSEVRAIKDVASFLEDPKVALDIDKTGVEDVLDEMLQVSVQYFTHTQTQILILF